jgi:hypothetical protein
VRSRAAAYSTQASVRRCQGLGRLSAVLAENIEAPGVAAILGVGKAPFLLSSTRLPSSA